MKNFLMIFALLTIMAGFSLAEDQSDSEDTPALTNTINNETLTNQIVNEAKDTTVAPPKKQRSKWDFSDHPEDKKKETTKKDKALSFKERYPQPESGQGKKWKSKKSVTTNNVTTTEVGN